MAITRITRKPRRIRFASYDLEWRRGTYLPTLAGAYDGDGYRPYSTVDGFLNGELTNESSGTVFFGHWSGRFDIQFLAKRMADHGANISLLLSGSGAPIVRVVKGRERWTFADCASILRVSLAKVGRSLGLPKFECDTETASWSELCEYNERDCQIPFVAIDRMQDELLSIGSEMRLTAASIALTTFRRLFLRGSVDTLSSMNELLRPFYIASRVEPWRRWVDDERDWRVYDVNSSYAWSMTRKVPGNLLRVERRVPRRTPSTFLLIDCDVVVPLSCKVPPTAIRHKGRVFFPTGTYPSIITEYDLDLIELVGASITNVRSVWVYALMKGLGDFVRFFYDLKKKYDSDPFLRAFYKVVPNSGYGKLGESSEKEALVLNPERTDCVHNGAHIDKDGQSTCMRLFEHPNIWSVRTSVDIAHSHIPAVMAITSSSKGRLGELFYHVYPDLSYGDTDCLDTPLSLPTSQELGDLKVEHHGQCFHRRSNAAPKLYMIDYGGCAVDGCDECVGGVIVRSKGFRRLSREAFEALENGDSVSDVRMAGLKESRLEPQDRAVVKTLRQCWYCPVCDAHAIESGICQYCWGPLERVLSARPKRVPDGAFSRPWSVDELNRPWEPRQ